MKAQVEVQFNWIYVSIVAAVAFFLLVGALAGIRRYALDQQSVDATSVIDNLLITLQGSPYTQHSTQLAGLEVEFDCDSYVIGTDERSLEYEAVFSAQTIQNTLLSYSLPYTRPFYVTNMLLVTDTSWQYIFVGDLGAVHARMPQNVQTILTPYAVTVQNQGFDHARFIFLTAPTSITVHNSFNRAQITKLQIDPDLNQGTARYFDKSNQLLGTVEYQSTQELLAIIFSSTPELFNCNQEKLFQRAKIQAQLYADRAQYLSTLDHFGSCEGYDAAFDLFVSYDPLIRSQLETIKNLNEQFHRSSCTTLY